MEQILANPFFSEFFTPHKTYPFQSIKNEHFLPAFERGMQEQNAEIQAIIKSEEKPNFENTIVALENSGALLSRVSGAFYNLLSAETSDELEKIAQELSPKLSEHSNAILLNEELFSRVKAVYNERETLNLNLEENALLEKTFKYFAENGANLSAEKKAEFRELSKVLSLRSLEFSQRVLRATNGWEFLVENEDDLSGLPEDLKENLKQQAEKKGKNGWLLSLNPTVLHPFLKFADNRDLRRKIWFANNTRCLLEGENDNREIVAEIVSARLKVARLLGHETHADRVLRRRMAETPKAVFDLLDELFKAYFPAAKSEVERVQNFAETLGFQGKLQSWDFAYYSEKLKNKLFSINDEILRPYFELENVKRGVFGVAERLYGLTFEKNEEIQVYHPEVEAFDVKDENGEFLAVLYADFHPREGKRGGAWMNEFKGQWREKSGEDSRPHIVIVMNFTRPTAEKPALLTFDEVNTFLHEFGHALHGMLTRCTYESLSGTNVYRDFVELPSQIMENFVCQKEFLDSFATHYQTGEKIPAQLIENIRQAQNFNVAYGCLRQLSFGYLDMAFHTLKNEFFGEIPEFEFNAIKKTLLLENQPQTAISTAFSHIFAGGYSAGYYSYKWAEVLDADAFSVFEENGIFDKKTAESFRKNILEKGAIEPPMTLYKRFRGAAPSVEALKKRNGIK